MSITNELIEASATTLICAGGAVLLGSPIGAAGGAIFGITNYLIGRPVSAITNAIVGYSLGGNIISRIIGLATGIMAGIFVTTKILSLMGISVSLSTAAALTIAPGIAVIAGLIAIIALAILLAIPRMV